MHSKFLYQLYKLSTTLYLNTFEKATCETLSACTCNGVTPSLLRALEIFRQATRFSCNQWIEGQKKPFPLAEMFLGCLELILTTIGTAPYSAASDGQKFYQIAFDLKILQSRGVFALKKSSSSAAECLQYAVALAEKIGGSKEMRQLSSV